jgi:non-heme chloroperoxidase
MGTGEVTRYLGTYGTAAVSKAVMIGSIAPYLLQAPDNPQGVPKDVFEGLKQAAVADRYAFLESFLANLYNADVCIPDRLSEAALRASSHVAYGGAPYATVACIDTWLTDFRGDLPKIDIPVLAVHGTADRILPFEVTTERLRDERLIADLAVVEIADGPHNVGWTHPDEINSALLSFLAGAAEEMSGSMATADRA